MRYPWSLEDILIIAEDDCDLLKARADMLYAGAYESVTRALCCGPAWNGLGALVEIAAHLQDMVEAVQARVKDEC